MLSFSFTKKDNSGTGRFTFGKMRLHFRTVLTHKKFVRQACFRMGLYRQGIFHDMSKFSPAEFVSGVRYFDGHRSPNAVERSLIGYSDAWLHHKGRNRHHYEYYCDHCLDGTFPMKGYRMPLRYVAEMVADRYAACRAYHGSDYSCADAWNYYERTRSHTMIEDETRAVLEQALIIMRDQGESAAFDFMKGILRSTKGCDYTAEKLGIPPAGTAFCSIPENPS